LTTTTTELKTTRMTTTITTASLTSSNSEADVNQRSVKEPTHQSRVQQALWGFGPMAPPPLFSFITGNDTNVIL
jgi:hypothetical protein